MRRLEDLTIYQLTQDFQRIANEAITKKFTAEEITKLHAQIIDTVKDLDETAKTVLEQSKTRALELIAEDKVRAADNASDFLIFLLIDYWASHTTHLDELYLSMQKLNETDLPLDLSSAQSEFGYRLRACSAFSLVAINIMRNNAEQYVTDGSQREMSGQEETDIQAAGTNEAFANSPSIIDRDSFIRTSNFLHAQTLEALEAAEPNTELRRTLATLVNHGVKVTEYTADPDHSHANHIKKFKESFTKAIPDLPPSATEKLPMVFPLILLLDLQDKISSSCEVSSKDADAEVQDKKDLSEMTSQEARADFFRQVLSVLSADINKFIQNPSAGDLSAFHTMSLLTEKKLKDLFPTLDQTDLEVVTKRIKLAQTTLLTLHFHTETRTYYQHLCDEKNKLGKASAPKALEDKISIASELLKALNADMSALILSPNTDSPTPTPNTFITALRTNLPVLTKHRDSATLNFLYNIFLTVTILCFGAGILVANKTKGSARFWESEFWNTQGQNFTNKITKLSYRCGLFTDGKGLKLSTVHPEQPPPVPAH